MVLTSWLIKIHCVNICKSQSGTWHVISTHILTIFIIHIYAYDCFTVLSTCIVLKIALLLIILEGLTWQWVKVGHFLFNDFTVFYPVKALLLDTLVVSNFYYYNSDHLTQKNLCLLLRFFLGQSPGVVVTETKYINIFKDL